MKRISLLGPMIQLQIMLFAYGFVCPSETVPDVPEILAMPVVQQDAVLPEHVGVTAK